MNFNRLWLSAQAYKLLRPAIAQYNSVNANEFVLTMIKIDRIIRSNRKTVALIIQSDGSLWVRAPLRSDRREIERIVQEKADWIQSRKRKITLEYSATRPYQFKEGEAIYYLGATYPLVISDEMGNYLKFDAQRFLISRQALPYAPHIFTRWYRRQAREIIGRRVEALSELYGCSYHRIRITSARSRWGSCGAKGTLNFTWRLVMAPSPVIDYVITHELMHLKIKNHSKEFWRAVAMWIPEYKNSKNWLRINGQRLMQLL